ncbi:MAG: ATP synthase F0 subunit C [Clostridiales bacterium]|nr:ATP synthase F0 subunit C [Clostridiales bacterium]
MSTEGIYALAACLGVGMAAVGASFAIGKATASAVEAAARQPEAAGSIQKLLLLGAALAEATAIYALIVALILLLLK